MSQERVLPTLWSQDRLNEVLNQEPYTDDTLKRERWLVYEAKQRDSTYRCEGSVRKAAQLWHQVEDGTVIGHCPVCKHTVLCYKDLGYYLCVEHLKSPKANQCGECQGPIWDDDYLCVWCRVIIEDAK